MRALRWLSAFRGALPTRPQKSSRPILTRGRRGDQIDLRVLVLGDSYANYGRFIPMLEVFEEAGVGGTVCSVSYPGASAKQLLANIEVNRLAELVCEDRPFHYGVLVVGVNDVAGRRGAGQYAAALTQLAAALGGFANKVRVISIPSFDAQRQLGTTIRRVLRKARAFVRDPRARPIERYRSAAEETGLAIIDSTAFLTRVEPEKFTDGVHFTDEQFVLFARFVADAILKDRAGDL